MRKQLLCAVAVASALVVVLCAESRATTLSLSFDAAVSGTLQDANGVGTGLLDRLSGTGGYVTGSSDSALVLGSGSLTMTPPNNYFAGENIGVNLSRLGFTGDEDFSVTIECNNPSLNAQYSAMGVFVGTASNNVIRAALMRTAVTGSTENDVRLVTSKTPSAQKDTWGSNATASTGTISISRTDGVWTTSVFGTSITSTTDPATYLNSATDLCVGIFGSGSGSSTWQINQFTAHVDAVPEPGTIALLATGLIGILAYAWRKRK